MMPIGVTQYVECLICGKTFRSRYRNAKYCSEECRVIGKHVLARTKTIDYYHSETLDVKAREWGIRYGKEQSKATLAMVGGVDVDGIMNELKK